MDRLAPCLAALSLAADLANGFPPEKVLRTIWLAHGLAEDLGLPPAVRRQTWWTPLIRYLGCTAFAWEEGRLYGAGDDRSVRRTMSIADVGAPWETLGRVTRGVAPEAPWWARMGAIARLLGDGVAIDAHNRACVESAGWLGRLAGISDDLVALVAPVDARWDGRGVPAGLAGEDIPLPVRIHQVADLAEVCWHREGAEAALAAVARRAGGALDPALATAFARVGPARLAAFAEGGAFERCLAAEPEPRLWVDAAGLDDVCRAFAHFADLKAPCFAGHSHGVSRLADRAAVLLGLSATQRVDLRRAGLVHDLGRVAVNNAVWERPGPLGYVDRERVREHALRTERILAASPVLAPLGALAASAHERLDGQGYHRALPAAALPLEARVLAAADVCQALGEPRPHRPAHPPEHVAALLAEEVRAGRLEAEAVRAVLMAAGHVREEVPAANPAGLSDREVEVLVLLARGLTNKEIGARLGISPKTAQHHVARIYDRIGLGSRAAACLYAVDHGLLARVPG